MLAAVLLCVGLIGGSAGAADSYTVNSGASVDIDEHSTCKEITNNHASGNSIMVPTKTDPEWQSFYNNLPASVTEGACSGGGAPTGCPTIGNVCSDGSVYAGITPDGGFKMYTTPADAGQFTWNNGTSNWVDTVLTNNVYVTGQADTATLVGLSDAASPYAAAVHCNNLTAHSRSDWYLPALDELDVLYTNHVAIGGFNTSGIAPAGAYWASSENDNQHAYFELFSTGYQDRSLKTDNFSVRCVRREVASNPCTDAGGTEVGGYCWFLSSSNQSCTSVCSTRNGYNEATNTYAGTAGTSSNCRDVLDALSAPGSGLPNGATGGFGCNANSAASQRWRTTDSTIAGNATTNVLRACACGLATSVAPTSVSFVTSTDFLDTTTVTIPASAQAGDLAIVVDGTFLNGGVPTLVYPAGYTLVSNTSGTNAYSVGHRVIVYAKILEASDPGSNITTMSGTTTTGWRRKAVHIFRPNTVATSFTVGSVNQESAFDPAQPSAQTITASGGSAPLVAFAVWRAGGAISTRGFTPAADAELTGDAAFYRKYKIYNSSPANISATMSAAGNERIMHSMYFELQ